MAPGCPVAASWKLPFPRRWAAVICGGAAAGCDYRVAGHDNHMMSNYTAPPLTTVTQNVERMGQLALDLLLSRMDEGEPPAEGGRILLDGELIVRASA